MKRTLILLFCLVLPAAVPGAAWFQIVQDTNWYFCAPMNGIRVGVQPRGDIAFRAQAVNAAGHGKEIVSLTTRHIGTLELLDKKGNKVESVVTNLGDITIYAPVLGGEFAPPPEIPNRRPPLYTFPTEPWNHIFIRLSTNQPSPGYLFGLTELFKVTAPGEYVLKYQPIFYMAEGPHKPTRSEPPPKYRRLVFPMLTVPVTIELTEGGPMVQ